MPTKKKYLRPTHVVITLPDPDALTSSSHAEVGGRMEWRCETANYPGFDIVFGEKNPFNHEKNYEAHGTIDEPVVRIVKNVGKYPYTVRHHPPPGSGGEAVETGPAMAIGWKCEGCPP